MSFQNQSKGNFFDICFEKTAERLSEPSNFQSFNVKQPPKKDVRCKPLRMREKSSFSEEQKTVLKNLRKPTFRINTVKE